MVDLIDPSVSFSNSFKAAQEVTDTFRRNMAFKALEKTYGPIVGDIDLATKAQTYGHNEVMNPLLTQEQQLQNAGLEQTNAFNAANNPLVLENNQLTNETAQFNLDEGQAKAEREAALRKAQEIHSTLGGVLGTMETALDGIIDPEQRGAVFDQQVAAVAPLIGVDPAALLAELGDQRAAIQTEGTAAIPKIRQLLDDTLFAGMDPLERQKLTTGVLDQQLKQAQIITEGAQAEKYLAEAAQEKVKAEKAAAEEVKEARVASRALDDFEAKQETVKQYIADAIQYAKDHPLATGAAASTPVFNQLPEIKNLAAKLKTIGANIGFAELSRIKSTGASLGPVSNYENELLQSVLGSIEQGQSQEQFVQSLLDLQETLDGSGARMRQAFEEDFGAVAADIAEDDAAVDYSDYFGAE